MFYFLSLLLLIFLLLWTYERENGKRTETHSEDKMKEEVTWKVRSPDQFATGRSSLVHLLVVGRRHLPFLIRKRILRNEGFKDVGTVKEGKAK